ncbi:MAG: hypothetical protein VX589_03630, partial [Myxococcota bacterium]|nr:hypothetical protein [Myxococcota bacterium]
MISQIHASLPQFKPPEHREVYRSGIHALDDLLGHGLTSGVTVEWLGPFSCGKTATLKVLVNAMRARGLSVAWIDAHQQLVAADWSESSLGCLWVVRPPRPEDAVVCAETILRTESFGLVVLDGATGLKGNLGTRLQRLARKTGSSLILIHHRSLMNGAHGRLQFEANVVESSVGLSQRGPFKWRVTIRNQR